MSIIGPKKDDTVKVAATSAYIANIALSTAHFTSSLTSLYSTVSTSISSLKNIAGTAVDLVRGKKRHADDALRAEPPAPAEELESRLAAALSPDSHTAVIPAAAAPTEISSNLAPALPASAQNEENNNDGSKRVRKNPHSVHFSAVDSANGQRLHEGREAMRKAGKRTEYKRADGEEPLARYIAREKRLGRKSN